MKKYNGSNSLTYLITLIKSALKGKSDVGHKHTKSEITDMPTKLSQFTNDSGFKTTDNNTTYTLTKSGSTITLTGSDGKNTSITDSDTKYSLPAAGTSLGGVQSGGDVTISNGVITVNDNSHAHTTANITGLDSKLSGKIDTSKIGAASGVASLGSDGKIPSSQLPSYVDDVIEGYYSGGKFYKESGHSTAITGESGKIYVDLHTNKSYRWSGSAFVEISSSIVIGTGSGTALDGKIGTDHINNKNNPHGVTKALVGLSNVENKSSATIRGELTKENVTNALGYTPPTTNTTYGVATSSTPGLVKSGTDISVDTSGNVSVNDNSHNHTISNVSGLQSALDEKQPKGSYAASSHTHTKSQITDMPTKLSQFTNDSGFKTTDTWIPLRGSTYYNDGTAGYAPAPSAGSNNRYLRSDGTWEVPPDTTYGTATQYQNGLMSTYDKQKLDTMNAVYFSTESVSSSIPLNADQLQGYSASYFAPASHNHDTRYASKSSSAEITIQPSQWSSGRYRISDSRITYSSNQDVLPPVYSDTNKPIIDALVAANLVDAGQGSGWADLQCMGTVPSIAVKIRVIFRGE